MEQNVNMNEFLNMAATNTPKYTSDNIKSKHKKFDKDLHDKYDREKKVAIEYFKKLGMYAYENPRKFEVDVIVEDKNNNNFYCEVEVKRLWKGEYFKFPDIQVLYRKKKYFTLDKPTVLMMFNEEITHALFLKSQDILESPKKEISNRYVKKGEFFFIVPLDKAIFVKV